LCPWPSFVQRAGRCNRRGKAKAGDKEPARVFWIDLPTSEAAKGENYSRPYDAAELDACRQALSGLRDAGPRSLAAIHHVPDRPVFHTLRRRDLLELFDTTPDLAGQDVDVS